MKMLLTYEEITGFSLYIKINNKMFCHSFQLVRYALMKKASKVNYVWLHNIDNRTE